MSDTPEFRCRGHCCRRFAIEHSLDDLQTDYELWRKDPRLSKIPDIEKIAPMVIWLESSRDGKEHVYTCKNLGADGNCQIYETRPQMCRDFPGEEGCHFWACESSQSAYFGMMLPSKIARRWRWLRELNKKYS